MPKYVSGGWMWAQACQLLDQAERLKNQSFRPGGPRGPTWEPPVDICETGDALRIEIALPGVTPERLQISVEAGAIHVVAERPLPAHRRHDVIRRLEIPYGRFERRIPLPAGRYEIGRRDFENGCVYLTLHKV